MYLSMLAAENNMPYLKSSFRCKKNVSYNFKKLDICCTCRVSCIFARHSFATFSGSGLKQGAAKSVIGTGYNTSTTLFKINYLSLILLTKNIKVSSLEH